LPAAAAIRGWLRRATALAGAVLIVACTARPGMSATGSHPAAQPPVAASADGCQLPVGNEPSPEGEIVLGIISLGPDFLQPAVPVHQRWWRYWQKHGLWIRAGHQAVTITVPRAWRNRAAITWGVNVGIASTLRLPGCPAGRGTWNGYAGGFYLAVELRMRAPGTRCRATQRGSQSRRRPSLRHGSLTNSSAVTRTARPQRSPARRPVAGPQDRSAWISAEYPSCRSIRIPSALLQWCLPYRWMVAVRRRRAAWAGGPQVGLPPGRP
jgi:hypothetical protein